MKVHHCWRCNRDLPFLDEREWSEIEPLLMDNIRFIKQHRAEHSSTIAEAKAAIRTPVMDRFQEMTGFDVHFDAIHHHRLSRYGPECRQCGHLLRSPTANFCANCGRRADVQYPRP